MSCPQPLPSSREGCDKEQTGQALLPGQKAGGDGTWLPDSSWALSLGLGLGDRADAQESGEGQAQSDSCRNRPPPSCSR